MKRIGGRALAGLITLAMATAMFAAAKTSTAQPPEPVSPIAFAEVPISPPNRADLVPLRPVNPNYQEIAGWISAVGAGIAAGDIDGNAKPDDACLVDPRTNQISILAAPGTEGRFSSFSLPILAGGHNPSTIAPMGCLIGDLNEDGLPDIVSYYWGRAPVIHFREAGRPLSADGYRAVSLIASDEAWFTNAALIADIDGDGHADLLFGNYFPEDAKVLDAAAEDGGKMQKSMSRAYNSGRKRLFLFDPASSHASGFTDHSSALTKKMANGWTLALAAADLDGDLKPEIYVANDFGPDRLLVNRSQPGRPAFILAEGDRGWFDTRSRVIGRDSFKGMGADFLDVNADGQLDLAVSNIAQPYALLESHFLWINQGDPDSLKNGHAAFTDASGTLGTARNGWAWDIKGADFDNDSRPEIVQAVGFLAGKVDRWPELQELATANDDLLPNTQIWPKFRDDADLSGHLTNAFYISGRDGRFRDMASKVGLGRTGVTRGIAVVDVDLDGRRDLFIARQWDQSSFYRNRTKGAGNQLTLDLRLRNPNGSSRLAYGAKVVVTDAAGKRQIGYVDGGNGHSGKNAPQVHFGLGKQAGPIRVEIKWRGSQGVLRRSFDLTPGFHSLILD
ncbi:MULTISPECIES: CRTAC1 family protein [unclassified Novosphingobium]|uniref:CRTAC1 family protein n=1 Tax=unclassified Novosphingobium TaxID=2644732 RepID=UPI0025FAE60F|nr:MULTISPECIES: CRTAC1 family protein [unclassified Novosphingobium]HQV04671.1 CRTAC1 family protein [Novosphingobium sp.]